MKGYKKELFFGFTLAETLITLVIIGVVAALTVPSLMNKTNNQETVSRLKKAYSILSQATNLIIANEGPVKSWDFTNDGNGAEKIYNLYKKHLIKTKDCSSETGCFRQGLYKSLNNHTWNFDTLEDRYKLILADGTQVMFDSYDLSNQCSSGGSEKFCMQIFVDINGEKKPNVMGRDLQRFLLKNNGLYPAGCLYANSCNNGDGQSCSCQVLRESAINY